MMVGITSLLRIWEREQVGKFTFFILYPQICHLETNLRLLKPKIMWKILTTLSIHPMSHPLPIKPKERSYEYRESAATKASGNSHGNTQWNSKRLEISFQDLHPKLLWLCGLSSFVFVVLLNLKSAHSETTEKFWILMDNMKGCSKSILVYTYPCCHIYVCWW